MRDSSRGLLVDAIHACYVWSRNLRTKDASKVTLKAFSSILEESMSMRKGTLRHPWTDQSTEYTNKLFKA